MTVIEIINIKLGDLQVDTNIKLLAVNEVETAIKNYCNLDTVPEELKYIWADMCVDLIRYQYVAGDTSSDDSEIGNSDISSVKVGDTTVNVGQGSPTNRTKLALQSHKPNLDNVVMNYKQQLQQFRRMVW